MANWTKEAFKEKIATNDTWLYRGILAIYAMQTPDEQGMGATVEDNGMGFNGVDAEIMSSFAEQIKDRGTLSFKQREIARKKMNKYAGQLVKIANGAS